VAGEAEARTEGVLAWTMILFRVGAFAEAAALNFVGDSGWRRQIPGFGAMLAVLGLESAAVVVLCLRRRRAPPGRLIAADSVLTAGIGVWMTVVASAALKGSGPDFLLPYMLLVAIGIGVGLRTLPGALAATAPLAAAYLYMQVFSGFFWLGAVPHTIGFWVNAGIAWFVASLLRRNAADLDKARGDVARLAAERERARNGRILHDRVLQTLEALTRDGWVNDEKVRRHVAAEARWLRRYVRGDHDSAGNNLVAALEEVVEQANQAGLTVQLHAVGLKSFDVVMPIATVEAVAGAVREALTNVLKHAGTGQATVHGQVRHGEIVVSVLDQGKGFDGRGTGMGQRESIEARIADIGGATLIDSTPGEGTLVELRVPR
jgi:signal transduction histidine kinase